MARKRQVSIVLYKSLVWLNQGLNRLSPACGSLYDLRCCKDAKPQQPTHLIQIDYCIYHPDTDWHKYSCTDWIFNILVRKALLISVSLTERHAQLLLIVYVSGIDWIALTQTDYDIYTTQGQTDISTHDPNRFNKNYFNQGQSVISISDTNYFIYSSQAVWSAFSIPETNWQLTPWFHCSWQNLTMRYATHILMPWEPNR